MTLWLTFGFMVVCYFVGGIGHGLKNVSLRMLIHQALLPTRRTRVEATAADASTIGSP